jgi:hypothetical protein
MFFWQRNKRELKIRYQLSDTHGVFWPEIDSSTRAYELWLTTCFELFILNPTQDGYLEYNFSPNTNWDCYLFNSYRSPNPVQRFDVPNPCMTVPEIGVLEVELTLPWESERYLSNPTAVIEDDHGLNFYAYKHAPERADFHFQDGLSLQL